MSNVKTSGMILGIIIGLIVICTVIFLNLSNDSKEILSSDSIFISNYNHSSVSEIINSELTLQTQKVKIDNDDIYFQFYLTPRDFIRVTQQNQDQLLDEVKIELKPEYFEKYALVKSNDNTVVIYPTFTSAAYSEPGFYTFFRSECDESCITNLSFKNPSLGFTSSGLATQLLYLLDYEFLTDIDVDTDPEILKNYDTVILLHNEYITKKMFDAITAHPNIVYLYPNALYAEIAVNYDDNTMTLVRGHNYPEFDIYNGFDYEIEQRFHEYEYDTDCFDWKFIEFKNGHALNCYPDLMLHTDWDLLLALKEF